ASLGSSPGCRSYRPDVVPLVTSLRAGGSMRLKTVLVAVLLAVPAAAMGQQPPAGDAVFARACASCHQPGQTAVPPPDALRAYTPEAIVNALTNGKMAVQGATLTTAERVAVAQFVTSKT